VWIGNYQIWKSANIKKLGFAFLINLTIKLVDLIAKVGCKQCQS